MKNYGPGSPVDTMAKFDDALTCGNILWVDNWNKTAHPSVLASMTYRTVKKFIEGGQVSIAARIHPTD